MKGIFDRCSSLNLINIKEININDDLKSQILRQNLNILTICNNNESNFETFFTKENDEICNDISNNDYDSFDEKKFECLSKNYCGLCGKNFFLKYNDSSNNYFICYTFLEGYYLDLTNSIFKPCYFSCKNCYRGGNEIEHNCLKCKEDFIYQ